MFKDDIPVKEREFTFCPELAYMEALRWDTEHYKGIDVGEVWGMCRHFAGASLPPITLWIIKRGVGDYTFFETQEEAEAFKVLLDI